MPTSVPAPTFGTNGFVAPEERDVLNGRLLDFNQAFGGGLNLQLSTPQGQLASSDAAILGDAYAVFVWLMNMVDPAFSEGRMQDALGRIYAIQRIAGRATIVTATCTGLAGTAIPIGALAQATDGNLYINQSAGTIGAGGTVDLQFACQNTGAIACPAHTLTQVYQALPGWDTIDNAAAGVLGRAVENRNDFELRRRASVGWQANGPLGAVLGAVLSVDGVADALAIDNSVGYARLDRGVVLAGNSIYVCVLGGTDADIALAILRHKAPGVGTTGSTSVLVEDPNPLYLPPHPTYTINFQRPTTAAFFMRVAIRASDDVPTDAESQVQNAVVPVFNGTLTEARERIGTTVYASRYYPIVEALGTWARRLISIDIAYGVEATFTGAVAGAVLTVSAVASGTLKPGQVIRDDLGDADGVMILDYDTGSGGVGTYLISPGRSVASRPMRALTAGNAITLDLDEAPSLAPIDVRLVIE